MWNSNIRDTDLIQPFITIYFKSEAKRLETVAGDIATVRSYQSRIPLQ